MINFILHYTAEVHTHLLRLDFLLTYWTLEYSVGIEEHTCYKLLWQANNCTLY